MREFIVTVTTDASGNATVRDFGLPLAALDTHTNLTYARYGERGLQLDLYRPKDATGALPAIVCIHGGGWFQGDRASMRPLAQALAARGFVTVTISYRLSGEEKFPAQIQDCKAAVRWLRANAAKFGVRPDAIGVTGLSAGGHLAALLALTPNDAEFQPGFEHADTSVTACVPFYGVYDLVEAFDPRGRAGPRGERVGDWFARRIAWRISIST